MGQKLLVPFGVPRPVGPSQPGPAVHHTAGLHEPFDPLVTSFNPPGFAQVSAAGYELNTPPRAYTLATIGDEALVPP
jgi:hypothetical protein